MIHIELDIDRYMYSGDPYVHIISDIYLHYETLKKTLFHHSSSMLHALRYIETDNSILYELNKFDYKAINQKQVY